MSSGMCKEFINLKYYCEVHLSNEVALVTGFGMKVQRQLLFRTSRTQFFSHSLKKLLSAYYVPDTVPKVADTVVNDTDKVFISLS